MHHGVQGILQIDRKTVHSSRKIKKNGSTTKTVSFKVKELLESKLLIKN
jgi:hypothetical protein